MKTIILFTALFFTLSFSTSIPDEVIRMATPKQAKYMNMLVKTERSLLNEHNRVTESLAYSRQLRNIASRQVSRMAEKLSVCQKSGCENLALHKQALLSAKSNHAEVQKHYAGQKNNVESVEQDLSELREKIVLARSIRMMPSVSARPMP